MYVVAFAATGVLLIVALPEEIVKAGGKADVPVISAPQRLHPDAAREKRTTSTPARLFELGPLPLKWQTCMHV